MFPLLHHMSSWLPQWSRRSQPAGPVGAAGRTWSSAFHVVCSFFDMWSLPLHFPAPTSSHYVYISISSTSGSVLLGQAEIEAKCLWRRRSSGGGFLKWFGVCLHICMSVVFRNEMQWKSPVHYKTAITNLLKCATVEVLIHSDKLFSCLNLFYILKLKMLLSVFSLLRTCFLPSRSRLKFL